MAMPPTTGPAIHALLLLPPLEEGELGELGEEGFEGEEEGMSLSDRTA